MFIKLKINFKVTSWKSKVLSTKGITILDITLAPKTLYHNGDKLRSNFKISVLEQNRKSLVLIFLNLKKTKKIV